jgi:hypothetical protein
MVLPAFMPRSEENEATGLHERLRGKHDGVGDDERPIGSARSRRI